MPPRWTSCLSLSSLSRPLTPSQHPALRFLNTQPTMSALPIPKTTRAIQFAKNGGPEVIELTEIDTPTPKADEILVKIEWGGVNFSKSCPVC